MTTSDVKTKTVSRSAQRERYVASLAEDLESVVEQLSAIPAVQRIILFGSYAAGRRDLFTDLDILVVMDSPLSFVPRKPILPAACARA